MAAALLSIQANGRTRIQYTIVEGDEEGRC
jgi:hypothetical protein